MKKAFIFGVFIAIVLSGVVKPLISQDNRNILTLENIYKNKVYGQDGYGPVRWMKDNMGYSTLEINEQTGTQDIVRYEAKTGQRSVLVSSSQLVPEGGSKPLSIKDYTWSEDNTKLLIFTNTRRLWRQHTRGDYWVLNLDSGVLQQLGISVERTTMMFGKFSPDAS
ncbi:MAG: dipeptidyl-peptidase-4, partial [Bacteroidia bacterium]